jgi:hypothetical protein
MTRRLRGGAVLRQMGRGIALYGIVAILLLIGGLKFTAVEIAASRS